MLTPFPHYRLEDSARLLAAVPVMRLARPKEALRFLQETLATVTELETVLKQYPATRYEPLDFAYVVLQSLGALDEYLVEDLTHHFGWPGVVWAGLLSALSPDAKFGTPLRAARGRVPHNQWAVDLALGVLGDPVRPKLQQHHDTLLRLREEFSHLPWPRVTLERAPSVEEARLRQERVREAYRQGGLEAALRARDN